MPSLPGTQSLPVVGGNRTWPPGPVPRSVGRGQGAICRAPRASVRSPVAVLAAIR